MTRITEFGSVFMLASCYFYFFFHLLLLLDKSQCQCCAFVAHCTGWSHGKRSEKEMNF